MNCFGRPLPPVKRRLRLHRNADGELTTQDGRYTLHHEDFEEPCDCAMSATGICQHVPAGYRMESAWTVWDNVEGDHAAGPFPFETQREARAWVEQHQ